jgi:hypothetical protein
MLTIAISNHKELVAHIAFILNSYLKIILPAAVPQ